MVIFVFAALVFGQSAPAPDVRDILRPNAPWTVDYAEDNCSLSREFGSGQVKLTVRRQHLERKGGAVVLTVPSTAWSTAQPFKGNLILADEAAVDIEITSDANVGEHVNALSFYLEEPALAELISTKLAAFPTSENQHIWLDLADFDTAVAALSRCSDDLVRSFGVSPEELDAVVVQAETLGRINLSPRRFPAELSGKRWKAHTSALFEINTRGRPSACRILTYEGPEALRGSVCDRPIRIRFRPAKNNVGAAVRTWIVVQTTTMPYP